MKIKIIFALVIFALAGLLVFMLDSKNSNESNGEETTYSDFQSTDVGGGVEINTQEETLDKKTEEFRYFHDSIYVDKTKIVSCENQKEGNAVVYIIDQSIDVDAKISEIRFTPVTNWEPYILRDIGYLLLPNIENPQNFPNLTFTYYDEYTKVARYENGAVKGSIYYSWRLNYLIIATSIECMNKAGDTVYQFS